MKFYPSQSYIHIDMSETDGAEMSTDFFLWAKWLFMCRRFSDKCVELLRWPRGGESLLLPIGTHDENKWTVPWMVFSCRVWHYLYIYSGSRRMVKIHYFHPSICFRQSSSFVIVVTIVTFVQLLSVLTIYNLCVHNSCSRNEKFRKYKNNYNIDNGKVPYENV